MSGKDVREFLYTSMRAQRRYETDDEPLPLPSAAQKDDRVLMLLNQLGERLIRSERERLELKETVGHYADLISALENKVNTQAAAEDELRQRQEKLEQDYAAQMQKMQKAVLLAERIEEAINQQNRLSRRIDQITQDKARMLRKLERIEEAVVETQTALNSKSLVLVSDQNRVVTDPSARIPRPANENDGLWQKSIGRRLASTVAAFVLISGLSWGVYESLSGLKTTEMPAEAAAESTQQEVTAENLLAMPPFAPGSPAAAEEEPSLDTSPDSQALASPPENDPTLEERVAENLIMPETPAPASAEASAATLPEDQPSTTEDATDILQKSDDELVDMLNKDPDALATALNSIAPSAAGIPQNMDIRPQATSSAAVSRQPAAPDTAVEDFLRAQRDSRPLKERIQPDPHLPAALKEIEAKAFQGIPEAQHDLAAIYTAGHGGAKTDFPRAALWFEEAALNNIANARYNLGVLYHQGLGVTQDTVKAINWYKTAAAQNHPEAQYNLGIAYIEGAGTEYSPQKAASHFESAARAGIREASYNLGLIYENGLLGSPQIEDAIYWYNRSAEQGSPEGKAALNQLARNMGYSDARLRDIYSRRKAAVEGSHVPVPAAAHSPIATPASAPAPSRPAADAIPVLPLDEEAAAQADPVPPASSRKTARSSLLDSGVIAQVQEQLMNYGLYPGPADGVYNDVMADAIRSYQKSHDLNPDGRASQALLVHMLSQEMGSREE